MTTEVSLQIFSHKFRLFSVLSQLIGSLPLIQPSVQGFIPNFGVPVRKAWTLSVLIGWVRTIGWCHLYLISRTIFHLQVCGARSVLVIPRWLSAAFWPTVFPMGGLMPSFRQVVEVSDPSFVFAPVRDGQNTIFCPFKSAVLALLLDGSSLVS